MYIGIDTAYIGIVCVCVYRERHSIGIGINTDRWLTEHVFISRSSGGWEVQDDGAGQFSCW